MTLVAPMNVTCQAPLSIGFPRQEHWSGLPFPSPGDLPNPRTELGSSALQLVSCMQVDSLPTEPPGKPISQMLVILGL